MRIALLAAAAGTLVTAGAATAAPQPPFSFGRAGGNILPFTVTILPDGRVTSDGATPRNARVSSGTLASLRQLGAAAGIGRLPALTLCPDTLPDFATFWIRVPTAAGSHRVAVRGSCVPSFTRLYRALSDAVGLPSG